MSTRVVRYLGQLGLGLLLLSLLSYGVNAQVQFAPVYVPGDKIDRHGISGSSGAVFGLSIPFALKNMYKTNSTYGGPYLGEPVTASGKVVYKYNPQSFAVVVGSNGKPVADRQDTPSGASLLTQKNQLFFVYTFAEPNPATANILGVFQTANGVFQTRRQERITFADYKGLWHPSCGSATPWQRHLGGEGSPPDAMLWQSAQCVFKGLLDGQFCLTDTDPQMAKDIFNMYRYYDIPLETITQKARDLGNNPEFRSTFKPYYYGYPFEIYLTGTNVFQNKAVKYFSMGRVNPGGIVAMQDRKTVYITGKEGGFFKYVANAAGDLSSGTLYAARFALQTAATTKRRLREDGAFTEAFAKPSSTIAAWKDQVFTIEWILLGAGDSQKIKATLFGTTPPGFNDVMYYGGAPDLRNGCPSNGNGPLLNAIEYNGQAECTRVKNTELAPFLETRRTALLKGATLDYFQFGGITTDDLSYLFVAATTTTNNTRFFRQSDGQTTAPPDLHDFVPYNPCGCVFVMDLQNYDAKTMRPLLCGDTDKGTDQGNSCNIENIANPSQVAYVNRFQGLVIGEDSTNHLNNFVWLYQVGSGGLTRIAYTPPGAGVTGMNSFRFVLGSYNYILMNMAHPYKNPTRFSSSNVTSGPYAWMDFWGPLPAAGSAIAFQPVARPIGDGPINNPAGSQRVVFGDIASMGWNTLLRDGIAFGGTTVGQVLTSQSKATFELADNIYAKQADAAQYSHAPGHLSLIPFSGCPTGFKGVKGVIQYNSKPAVMYVLDMEQDQVDGKLSVADVSVVDWSEYGGLMAPSLGQYSPWNTHLVGESIAVDARKIVESGCLDKGQNSPCLKYYDPTTYSHVISQLRYFDMYEGTNSNDPGISMDKFKSVFHPYNYGYIAETIPHQTGCIYNKKHFSLGRFDHAGLVVMPDLKTIYMSDGGNYGGFYKYVADTVGYLSQGTLYAAAMSGSTDPKTGSVDPLKVTWIKLGSASDSELEGVAATTVFQDIFDTKDALTSLDATGQPNYKYCPTGYKAVYAYPNSNDVTEPECLKVKTGKEKLAAFFETRRYAAMMGASIEFSDAKGLTYDSTNNRVYLAVSQVYLRMAFDDNDGEKNGTQNIEYRWNPCGGIFQFAVDPTSLDINSMALLYSPKTKVIATEFDLTRMCVGDDLANPLSLTFVDGDNNLLITEDPSNRYLDKAKDLDGDYQDSDSSDTNIPMSWSLDLATGDLSRVMTGPYEAYIGHSTIYHDIGGWGYITSTVGNAYKKTGTLNDYIKQSKWEGNSGIYGTLGYLGPWKKVRDSYGYYCHGYKDPAIAADFTCPLNATLNGLSAPPAPRAPPTTTKPKYDNLQDGADGQAGGDGSSSDNGDYTDAGSTGGTDTGAGTQTNTTAKSAASSTAISVLLFLLGIFCASLKV